MERRSNLYLDKTMSLQIFYIRKKCPDRTSDKCSENSSSFCPEEKKEHKTSPSEKD